MDLSDFEGDWMLDRRVVNAVGPDAVFTGTARFARNGAELVLTEAGEMVIDGQAPMQGQRVYHWRQGGAGIEVFFDDGRFFHLIAPGAQVEAHHDCPPDIYDVRYDFSGWDISGGLEWRAVWQVKGPRKDYRMESHYTRQP